MSAVSDGTLLIHLGQIWWVNVPHTDSEAKLDRRPAAIVGWSQFFKNNDEIILVVPITSHGNGGQPRTVEIEIPEPEKYKLDSGSHIRARNIYSIHPSRLTKKDGPLDTLSDDLISQTLQIISNLFTVQGPVRAR